jgi:hypothetical protein
VLVTQTFGDSIEKQMDMKRVSTFFAAVVFAVPVTLFAAGVPSPDKLLPADTLATFTIPDYTKASSTWAQMPGTLLWKDASMKAFTEKFSSKFQSDVIKPMERDFGMKFSDFAGLAKGQLTLAVTQNGWSMDKPDSSPGFLFLVDTRDQSATLKTNLSTLKQKWIDSGKQVRVEKIRDVEFTTLIFSSDDLSKALEKTLPDPNSGFETLDAPKTKKAPHKVEWTIGQSGSLFILGNAPKDIEKILIRQADGAVPSLSEQASFAGNYNSLFRDSMAYAWINVKAIMAIFTKGGGPEKSVPEQMLSAVGLTGLQTFGAYMQQQAEGTYVGFQLSVPESARKGLFKVLVADAKESAPPAFVPADAVKFSRWRLDLPKAFEGLENMVKDVNPTYGNLLKTVVDMAGKDKDPNFDLRKNLIANLGDDLVSYERAPRKQTLADLQSPPKLFLLSSPKPEVLASSVKALTSIMPQAGGAAKIKEREFLGRKVYSMALPAAPQADGGKPIEKSLHYAASGSYVAMSTDVALLEEYLRGNESKGLRETAGLADAAQKVGGMGTGLFGYENQSESMRVLVETMKKESGSLANLLSSSPLAGRLGMGDDSKKFKDWVDFSLLPSYDQISKYFYFNVWSGSANADGLNFKVFGPNPPQLKK